MVNVLYDFNGLTPWFVPYIGAGVGYVGSTRSWHAYNTFAFTVPALLDVRRSDLRSRDC